MTSTLIWMVLILAINTASISLYRCYKTPNEKAAFISGLVGILSVPIHMVSIVKALSIAFLNSPGEATVYKSNDLPLFVLIGATLVSTFAVLRYFKIKYFDARSSQADS